MFAQITVFRPMNARRLGLLLSLHSAHRFAADIIKVAAEKAGTNLPANAMPDIFFPILHTSFVAYADGKSPLAQTKEIASLVKTFMKHRNFPQVLKLHEKGVSYAVKKCREDFETGVTFFQILQLVLGKMSAADATRLQEHLRVEMDRNGVSPVYGDGKWKDFWDYLTAIAALQGKKIVMAATPGRGVISAPATPVADGSSKRRTGGGRSSARLSLASSLGTIDENDDTSNFTVPDVDMDQTGAGEEEEEEESSLKDVRRRPIVTQFTRGTKRKAGGEEEEEEGEGESTPKAKKAREAQVKGKNPAPAKKAAPPTAGRRAPKRKEEEEEEEEEKEPEEEQEEEEEEEEEKPTPRRQRARAPAIQMPLVESDHEDESDLEEGL